MPDKKEFNMNLVDIACSIARHCKWKDTDNFVDSIRSKPLNGVWDISCNLPDDDERSRIRVVFTTEGKYLYVFAYKGESTYMSYLRTDYLKQNWLLRYSPESIDMRYRPGEDWNVCGFIYELYDRITWESLKGVDEDA